MFEILGAILVWILIEKFGPEDYSRGSCNPLK